MSINRYEGAEKTLEVHFSSNGTPGATLRDLPRAAWDEILDYARCRILSKSSSAAMDAYVLSESSLFVYDCKLYLKTCGKTTLLKCLPPLLKAVAGLPGNTTRLIPKWLRFSHKNFAFPLDQTFPHSSFEQETQFCLNSCSALSNDSSAHVLGDMLSDSWNVLYVPIQDDDFIHVEEERPASPPSVANLEASLRHQTVSPALSSSPMSSNSESTSTPNDPARNNENIVNIMMYGIDREVAAHFAMRANESRLESVLRATKESGIESIFPNDDTIFDGYMFDPCGYSLNVVICSEYYATIHITPEEDFSYASFETNFPTPSYEALLRNVLNVFRPSKCTVALFSDCKRRECLSVLNEKPNRDVYLRVSHGSTRIRNMFFAEMSSFCRT